MSSRALTPTTQRDLAFSGWLDLFRGLAALAVLFGHARALFLSSMAPGQTLSAFSKVLYFLSGFGHLAVMVFFVLSGYLVGGTVIRAVRDDRWSWGRYLLQRGTRLYIVLIPALLLTLFWDYGERVRAAGLTPNDDTAVANIRSETIREHTDPLIFAGNVLFLQTVAVPPLGSNTPLWSLTNEFWYYLVFPLVWIAVARPGVKFWVRSAHLLVAAAILCLLGKTIALHFAIWLLGAGVAVLPEAGRLRRDAVRRFATAVTAAGLFAALIRARVGSRCNEGVTDSLVATAFAVLLYCMKHNRAPAVHAAVRRTTEVVANFSYTLYLVHLPPLIFLRACLTYEVAWPPALSSWVRLLLIMFVITSYAYLISLITERQTDRLRHWFERLGRRTQIRAQERVSCPAM